MTKKTDLASLARDLEISGEPSAKLVNWLQRANALERERYANLGIAGWVALAAHYGDDRAVVRLVHWAAHGRVWMDTLYPPPGPTAVEDITLPPYGDVPGVDVRRGLRRAAEMLLRRGGTHFAALIAAVSGLDRPLCWGRSRWDAPLTGGDAAAILAAAVEMAAWIPPLDGACVTADLGWSRDDAPYEERRRHLRDLLEAALSGDLDAARRLGAAVGHLPTVRG